MRYNAAAFAIDSDGNSGDALAEASGTFLPDVLQEITGTLAPDAFDEAKRGEIIVEMS